MAGWGWTTGDFPQVVIRHACAAAVHPCWAKAIDQRQSGAIHNAESVHRTGRHARLIIHYREASDGRRQDFRTFLDPSLDPLLAVIIRMVGRLTHAMRVLAKWIRVRRQSSSIRPGIAAGFERLAATEWPAA
jgi:hypothetical protein